MSLHLMVDLETMALTPDACIVQAGFCWFDAAGVIVARRFNVEWQSKGAQIHQPGRFRDPATQFWWEQQSAEIRDDVLYGPCRVALDRVLDELADHFRGEPDTRIWSNGANFDEVLLAHAYRQRGERTPWKHNTVRCFRTVRALFPGHDAPDEGRHDAASDAIWQARTLLNIARAGHIAL